MSRLVSEAGDPRVEARPEHVADLRALILERLGPPPVDRRSRTRWLMVAGLAAACLLAVVAWPRGDGKGPVSDPPEPRFSGGVALRPRQDPAGLDAWLNVRKGLDVSEMPAFSWPVQGSSTLSASTSIPPDLLD